MKVLELINFDLKLSLENRADLVIGVDEVGRGSLAGPVVCAAYSSKYFSQKPLQASLIDSEYIDRDYQQGLIKLDDSKKVKSKDRALIVDTLKHEIPDSFYAIKGNTARYIDEYGIVKAIFSAMAAAILDIIKEFKDYTKHYPERILILVDGPKPIPELDLYIRQNLKISVCKNGRVAERTSLRLRRTNDRSVRVISGDAEHATLMSYASKRKYKLDLSSLHEDHEDDENAKIGVPLHAQNINFNIEQIAIKKGDSLSAAIAAASNIAKDYRDQLMKNLPLKEPKFKVYGWETNVGYGSLKHREAILQHGLTEYHRKTFCKSF